MRPLQSTASQPFSSGARLTPEPVGRVTPCAPSWQIQILPFAITTITNPVMLVGRRRRAEDCPPYHARIAAACPPPVAAGILPAVEPALPARRRLLPIGHSTPSYPRASTSVIGCWAWWPSARTVGCRMFGPIRPLCPFLKPPAIPASTNRPANKSILHPQPSTLA